MQQQQQQQQMRPNTVHRIDNSATAGRISHQARQRQGVPTPPPRFGSTYPAPEGHSGQFYANQGVPHYPQTVGQVGAVTAAVRGPSRGVGAQQQQRLPTSDDEDEDLQKALELSLVES
eukprot:Trichotokara_eunicae@DN4852_c0_g1_i2.p1